MKHISYLICLLCCFAVFFSPNLSESAKSAFNTDFRFAGIDISDLDGLHIIGVDSENVFRWAIWSQRTKGVPTVKLALLKNTDKGLVVLQTLERPDAYEPNIKRLHQWCFGKYPVVALTYQYGAAVEQLEIFGIDKNFRPALLDEQLGDLIQWALCDGQTIVGVYSRPEGRLVPTWYSWQEDKHKLIQSPCFPLN